MQNRIFTMTKLFRKKDAVTMIEAAQASGGLKRTLTVANLVTLGVGAIVGTGIFVLTGHAAADHAGPALTISFLISAVGCVFAGLCYAEFAAMIPVSGSVYSYSYATMGEFLAWFIGWDLVLEYLFACSTVAVGWSGYLQNLLGDLGIVLPQHLQCSLFDHSRIVNGEVVHGLINFPAVCVVAIVTAFLFSGVKQSAWVNNVIVIIKVCVILLFIGFGLSYVNVENWTPYIPERITDAAGHAHFGWSGIFRGAAVVFFAYIGFDALSTTAQETRNPQRDMPKGILLSLGICALLYVAVTAVLTGIIHYSNLHVDAPIALAIDSVGKGLAWLSPFIKLGALAGLSSVILVMMLGQSRIYYAISNDGLLPGALSRIHHKSGVPRNATVLASIATGAIAGFLPLAMLGELVSIGTLLAFTIVCVSIVVLRKTQPTLKRPFKVPLVPFVPLLGAAICLLQMLSLPWNTWLRLIVWTVVGVILYFSYGFWHSRLREK